MGKFQRDNLGSNSKRYGLLAGLTAALMSSTAIAQDTEEDEERGRGAFSIMEQVTVTAQKREQSAQDVGIAITTLTGNQLDALGFTNAQEVTAMAAGVSTLQPNGEANYSIGIRGVANNDFTTNVESPIALYVDETYISQTSGAGFLLFDVERVEILRGPQGTLFGRNATGGLVHYITVKPSQEINGYGRITYGRFQDQGADRVKFQGAFGFPITDTLSGRISVATHQGEGYITNRLSPESDLNNANDYAARLQLLFEPNEDVSFLANVRYARQDIRTGFFEYESAIFPTSTATPGVPNPDLGGYVDLDGDVFAGDYDSPGRNELEAVGASGTLNWDVGFGEIVNIVDYQSVKRDYIEDSDASPFNYFNFFLTTDAQQFSEEFRLSGETGRLKWVAGLYYLNLDIEDSNGGITVGLFEGLADVGFFGPDAIGFTVDDLGFNGIRNPYTIERDSFSLFTQLEFEVSEKISIIGGFRYITESADFTYANQLVFFSDTAVSGLAPDTIFVADALPPVVTDRSDDEFAARVEIDYRANENLLIYASWNRGVKAGGFNAPLLPSEFALETEFITYDPEKLDAFEAGFKWDFAEGRARVNGAAYYYDYRDYQAFSIIGLDTATLNADAEVMGFELEFSASPTEGLDIIFGIAYVDADVTNIPGVTIDVETSIGTVPAILPGATVKPVQTPDWNLNGLIRYEFGVGNGTVALQGDWQYRSEHFFQLTNVPAGTEDGYFIANASITWFPENDQWSVRAFIQNLTDEEYLVQTFDLSGNITNGGLFGLIEQYYGRPLFWGFEVGYSF